jgi:CheY-like chemotaxis protein
MGGKRILVVDDSLAGREFLRAALEPQYKVEEATDGKAAVDSIHASRPDLVLMDIHMPVMDGYQAIQEIRRDATLTSLPVIAITAFAKFEDRHKALNAGFNGYLPKPINVTSLRMQIELLLKHS